jgi:transcription elongation factor GreA
VRIPIRKSERDRRLLSGDEPIYLTKSGYEKMVRNLQRLKLDLPRLREELQRTREMGDLSENAAYTIAKSKLRQTDNRIQKIEFDLKKIIIIELGDTDKIDLGSKFKVRVNEQEHTFTLVGEREANPINGFISSLSPLGQAVFGLRMKDSFWYKIGEKQFEGIVLEIYSG